MPNQGEADFDFRTKEGKAQSWLFQVAEVNKILASVSTLVDSMCRVTFDQDEATGEDLSIILNKRTGDTIKMRRERNVWVVDAYVDEDFEDTPTIDSVFTGPE